MAFQTNNSFQLLKKRDQNYCGAWLPTKLNFHINDTLFFALSNSMLLLHELVFYFAMILDKAPRETVVVTVDMVDAGSRQRSVQKKGKSRKRKPFA